jgi:hypothetical protein
MRLKFSTSISSTLEPRIASLLAFRPVCCARARGLDVFVVIVVRNISEFATKGLVFLAEFFAALIVSKRDHMTASYHSDQKEHSKKTHSLGTR